LLLPGARTLGGRSRQEVDRLELGPGGPRGLVF
jgi:hypothetical protein